MRDSLKKKNKEESDYPGGKEEAEINRKRKKKHRDRKGKVDCITLSNNISHLDYLARCFSLSRCVFAEQAFTSTSSFTQQYHLSAVMHDIHFPQLARCDFITTP